MGTLDRKAKAGDVSRLPYNPVPLQPAAELGNAHVAPQFRAERKPILSKELDETILNYIATLEETNDGLVKTLKKCVVLLTHFKSSVPDPMSWQKMLYKFQETIKVSERVIGGKKLH